MFIIAHGLSLVAVGDGVLFVVVHRLLIAVVSLDTEHRLQGTQASVVAASRLNCSTVCGIFPDQGLNQCPLHCKADA